MKIRRTEKKDIDVIMNIYERAKKFMAENGNKTQWGGSYPDIKLVEIDVEKDGYVIVEDDQIIGVFVLEENAKEPAYRNIDGAWLNDKPYAAIHRCASSGTNKGVGQFLLDWCFNKVDNICIDTHEDNIPMKNLLNKNGYTYCGKIHYTAEDYGIDYGERIAFQKCK